MSPRNPTWHEERALVGDGFAFVAGVDEAGTGCLAGPVYAAAVILPMTSRLGLIRDSKTLSALQRGRLIDDIKRKASAWAVGRASWEEVDALNVRGAAALAMRRAVECLMVRPDFVISDAFPVPGLAMPQKAIVKADLKVKSVAAASVLAKVERDREMEELDRRHPGYGFAVHKGYGTAAHLAALRRLGPSGIHRKTFAPVIDACRKSTYS